MIPCLDSLTHSCRWFVRLDKSTTAIAESTKMPSFQNLWQVYIVERTFHVGTKSLWTGNVERPTAVEAEEKLASRPLHPTLKPGKHDARIDCLSRYLSSRGSRALLINHMDGYYGCDQSHSPASGKIKCSFHEPIDSL